MLLSYRANNFSSSSLLNFSFHCNNLFPGWKVIAVSEPIKHRSFVLVDRAVAGPLHRYIPLHLECIKPSASLRIVLPGPPRILSSSVFPAPFIPRPRSTSDLCSALTRRRKIKERTNNITRLEGEGGAVMLGDSALILRGRINKFSALYNRNARRERTSCLIIQWPPKSSPASTFADTDFSKSKNCVRKGESNIFYFFQ